MYKLNVISDFSAAHHLQDYDGKCKNLHGHNWKVRVSVICEKTDEIGLTIDYGIVKKILNEIMEKLDHSYLNELESFAGINPTSENIAKFIFEEMKQKISVDFCRISEVEIWESDRTSMIYFE